MVPRKDSLLASIREAARRRDEPTLTRIADALASDGLVPTTLKLALANAFRQSGAVEKAHAWLSKITADDPAHERARAQTVWALQAQQRHAEIVRMTDPDQPDDLDDALAAARVRALVQLRREPEALELARRIEQSRGLSGVMLDAAVDCALAAKEWPAALAWLETCLPLTDDPKVHFRLGYVLAQLGRLDDAAESLRLAAESNEFFVRASLLLAKVHHWQERPARAADCCHAVLQREPDDPAALEGVIFHFIEAREFKSARAAFEQAVERHPDQFNWPMFEFLQSERRGNLRRGLRSFPDGEVDRGLSDEFKLRVANAFYYIGKLGLARKLARDLPEPARTSLQAKIALAAHTPFNFDRLGDGRDAVLIRALAAYQEERFDDCVNSLEGLRAWPGVKMAIENFRDLAKTRRRLSIDCFGTANAPTTRSDGPLPIIQQLWVGSALSRIERLSIRSFLACGHKVHLYTYDSNLEVPAGCELKDAADIVPSSRIFTHSRLTGRSRGSLAGFADMFRWKLIYEKGGAWADTDLICLRTITSNEIIATELARVGTVIVPSITNCFFAAEPGEPAFEAAYEQAIASNPEALLWGEIGVHRMARIAAEQGWGGRLAEPNDFCPVPHFQAIDTIDGAFDVRPLLARTNCRAVHLYHEMLRAGGIEKDRIFPPHSLIEVLDRQVNENECAGRQTGQPTRV